MSARIMLGVVVVGGAVLLKMQAAKADTCFDIGDLIAREIADRVMTLCREEYGKIMSYPKMLEFGNGMVSRAMTSTELKAQCFNSGRPAYFKKEMASGVIEGGRKRGEFKKFCNYRDFLE